MNIKYPDLSTSQSAYLVTIRREHQLILFLRAAVLILFLVLWEWTANTGIIDSFIFSSPSKIGTCFLTMAKDGTIFPHMSATLYETILSFLLVMSSQKWYCLPPFLQSSVP